MTSIFPAPLSVTFEVIGIPAPQGSIKAFAVNGRAMMKPSGGDKFAQWRNAVSQAAKVVAAGGPALDGPLGLHVQFRFPMPKSRPKRLHEIGTAWKTTAPDTDKLVRAVGDALTAAQLVRDDSLFVAVTATKIETTGWTGAVITVSERGEPRE